MRGILALVGAKADERAFLMESADAMLSGKAFRTRNALKTHVKSLHTLERPFLCTHPGCGMTYMTKIDLQRHMVRHIRIHAD